MPLLCTKIYLEERIHHSPLIASLNKYTVISLRSSMILQELVICENYPLFRQRLPIFTTHFSLQSTLTFAVYCNQDCLVNKKKLFDTLKCFEFSRNIWELYYENNFAILIYSYSSGMGARTKFRMISFIFSARSYYG